MSEESQKTPYDSLKKSEQKAVLANAYFVSLVAMWGFDSVASMAAKPLGYTLDFPSAKDFAEDSEALEEYQAWVANTQESMARVLHYYMQDDSSHPIVALAGCFAQRVQMAKKTAIEKPKEQPEKGKKPKATPEKHPTILHGKANGKEQKSKVIVS